MDNDYVIGMILYKNIKDNTLEFIRVLDVDNDSITILRLNDNKIFKNIKIEKIKLRYNILNPHIVISHLTCEDTERLLIKCIKESNVPNYIYDDNLKYHYNIFNENIIGFNYISNPIEVNKLYLYYIDNISKFIDFISKYNSKYIKMKNIINDDIIQDIYYDNNITILDEDIEYDNDLIIKYHLGLDLNTIENYKIINANNGIFINK